MGLDETTVYRYARAFTTLGVDQYLAHQQPSYWGLLTSAQLAHLCQQGQRDALHRLQGPAGVAAAHVPGGPRSRA